MKTEIISVNFRGSELEFLNIESCQSRGFSGIQTLGFHNDSAKGIREKVSGILEFCGVKLGSKKILLSCSPPESNHSRHLDLPAALSLFALHQDQPLPHLHNLAAGGELTLTGQIRRMSGVIPFVLEAKGRGITSLILPLENKQEVDLIADQSQILNDLAIYYFSEFNGVASWIKNKVYEEPPKSTYEFKKPSIKNFDDMHLTEDMKEFISVVAIGGHNIFLSGTPGTGKSMLSQRLPSILPPLSGDDHIQLLRTHSLAGNSLGQNLCGHPPFRAPHHLSSPQAILGTTEQPGDISLAHGGILFLDELPEFRRDLLESLREPLETGLIHVSRAQKKTTWQCRTILVAAANNCPCGWLGSTRQLCHCPVQRIRSYQQKLSGPLMDRIDIHIPMTEYEKNNFLLENDFPNQTQILKDKVLEVRDRIDKRLKDLALNYNRDIPSSKILDLCEFDSKTKPSVLSLLTQTLPSRRSQVRSLRVARTLADREHRKSVTVTDVKKAISWRP